MMKSSRNETKRQMNIEKDTGAILSGKDHTVILGDNTVILKDHSVILSDSEGSIRTTDSSVAKLPQNDNSKLFSIINTHKNLVFAGVFVFLFGLFALVSFGASGQAQAAQFARPTSDVSIGTWTGSPTNTTNNRYQNIDEVTGSDSDYVRSENNPPVERNADFGLSSVADPASSTGHIVRYRYQKNQSGGGQPASLNAYVYLLEGTTVIASQTHTDVGTGYTAGSFTLTGTEADSITDYSNLRIRVGALATGGARTSWIEVSWAELEVPNVPVTFSGTIYQNDESTTYTATNPSMKLSVEGGTAYTTTASSGTFSFSVTTPPTAGQDVTIWLDTGGGVQGTLVLKYGTSCTGNPDCTGLSLVVDQVRLQSFNGSNIINTDLSACDNDTGTGCSDTDIGFTVVGTTLTATSWTSTQEIKVVSATTYAPGGNTTTDRIDIAGTYTGSTETLNLGISTAGWNSLTCTNSDAVALCVSGTFTAPALTTIQIGADATVPALTYNDLTLTSWVTLADFTFASGTFTIEDLIVTYGFPAVTNVLDWDTNDPTVNATTIDIRETFTLNAGASTITISGSGTPLKVSGSLNAGTSTITFTGSTATNIPDLSYYNLTIDPASGTPTYTLVDHLEADLSRNFSYTFSALGYDSTNGIIYAAKQSIAEIQKCNLSTNCDANGDWSNPYDPPSENMVTTFTFDDVNNVLYMGSGGGGSTPDSLIYRCAGADPCTWAVSIDPSSDIGVRDLLFIDRSTDKIFASVSRAAGGDDIYYCDTSSNCDASGDWTSYGTFDSVYEFAYDSVNDVLYSIGYDSGITSTIVRRCDIGSTACDAPGDWTTSFSVGGAGGLAMIYDSTNQVLYAGDQVDGEIYRCDISATSCDASGDWITAFTGTGPIIGLSIDTDIGVVFATTNQGELVRCLMSTDCNTDADWTEDVNHTSLMAGMLYVSSEKEFYHTTDGSLGSVMRSDFSVNGGFAADIANTLTISSDGALDASNSYITIGNDFTNNGTFTASTSTVLFNDNSQVSQISGSVTFNNLTVTTAGKDLEFTAGQTFAVNGILTLTGATGAGNEVTLNSTTGTSAWTINTTGLDSSSVTYTTVTWSACTVSTPTIDMTGTGNTDGGNNGACWSFPAGGITISGTIFQNDEVTTYTATNPSMKLSVEGATAESTTASSGVFSFTSVATPTNGDDITIWLDTGGGVQGTLVFKYGASCTGTPDCTGLSVVVDQIRLENFHTGNIDVDDLSACDNDSGTGCGGGAAENDIGFTADGTTLTATTWSSTEVKVASGETVQAGLGSLFLTTDKLDLAGTWGTGEWGTMTLRGSGTSTTCTTASALPLCGAGTVNLGAGSGGTVKYTSTTNTDIMARSDYPMLEFAPASGSPTYTLQSGTFATEASFGDFIVGDGTNVVTVDAETNDPIIDVGRDVIIKASGVFQASSTASFTVDEDWNNAGTYTAGSGTVTFDGVSTADIIDGGSNFDSITFNNGSGNWTFADSTILGGNLTVTAGTLDGTNDITVNGGAATGNGTISLTGGTFLLDGAGNFGGNTAWTFNNLTIGDGTGSTATTATGTGSITVSNVLTISANQTFTTNSKSYTLSGSGTPLVVDPAATFNNTNSTFNYTASAATTVAATNYGTLNISPGGATVTHTIASGTLTVASDLTLGNAAFSGDIIDATLNDPTINVTGNLTIALNSIFEATSGTTTVTGSWTNNGTQNHSNGTFVFDGVSSYSLTGDSSCGTFYTLTFSGGGSSTWTKSDQSLCITNGLTINGGTLDSRNIYLNGNAGGNGRLTITTNGDNFTLVDGNLTNTDQWIVENLTLGDGGSATHNFSGAGSIDVYGVITIQANHTLNAGSKSIRLYGTDGTPFVNSGTFNADTSSVHYSGNNSAGNTNVAAETYWDLTINNTSETFDLAGATVVSDDLTITAGILDVVDTQNYSLTVGGNWSNSGTFTARAGTVTFNAEDSGNTITDGGSDWNNVTLDGIGGSEWAFQDATVINGDLLINAGDLTGTNDITVNGGDVTGTTSDAVINLTGGTFTLAGTGNFGPDGTAWIFNNLTFSGVTTSVHSGGTENIAINGTLTIDASDTLNAGNGTEWYMNGTGTPLSLGAGAVFNAQTSLFSYGNASGVTALSDTAMTGSNAFYYLAIFRFTGAPATFTAGVDIEAEQKLFIRNSTLAMGSNNLTVGNTAVANSGRIILYPSDDSIITQDAAATTTVRSSSGGSGCIGLSTNSTNCIETVDDSGTGSLTFGNLTLGDGTTTQTINMVGGDTTSLPITVGGVLTVSANTTLDLDGSADGAQTDIDFTSNGSPLVINGIFTSGTSVLSFVPTSTTGVTLPAVDYYSLVLDRASNTFTPDSGTINVGGNVTVTNGVLDIAANDPTVTITGVLTNGGTVTASDVSNLTLGGGFTNNGTFTHSSGLVTITPPAADLTFEFNGTNGINFYDFTATTPNTRLEFKNGNTYGFAGAMTITGQPGKLIWLESDVAGSQWTINFTGTDSLIWINVKDSACSGNNISSRHRVYSQGNNGACWNFISRGNGGLLNPPTGGGAGGTGGTSGGTVTLATALATAVESGGIIISITVTDGGSGYNLAPVLTICAVGAGSGATGTATLTGNSVSSIAVDNGGSGYSSGATVSVASPSNPTSAPTCGGTGGGGSGGGGGGSP